MPVDSLLPRRMQLPPALDQIARTPILRGKIRKYYSITFPDITLNQQEYNAAVLKIPTDTIFLIRQVHMLADSTFTLAAGGLGKGRFSIASGTRSNMAMSNDLLFLEHLGSFHPNKVSRLLYVPSPVMPGAIVTFEAQNLDSSTHTFKATLEGELLYNPDLQTVGYFSKYTVFQYGNLAVTVDLSATATSFSEIRTHPDSDFYITHFISTQTIADDNASRSGPLRVKVYLGSQGEPIMDSLIHTLNFCGNYFWYEPSPSTNDTVGQNHMSQATPLPYPIRVPAGSSVFIQASQPNGSGSPTMDLVLEGIKVFL